MNIGDKVKITSDNENYNNYKNKVLIIDLVEANTHPGFDPAAGSYLYEFTDEDGQDVPFALYDWEFKKA